MKAFNIILGIYALFNSLYCIFWPEESVLGLGWTVAGLLALWGIASTAEYFISHKANKGLKANGSIGLILGIAAMAVSVIAMTSDILATVFTIIVIVCLALGIIVMGISELVDSAKVKKEGKKIGGTIAAGIFHLLAGIFGLLSIVFMSESAPLAIGIMLLVIALAEFSSVFGSSSGSGQSEIW